MKSKFHSGEIVVQTRAGVSDIAQRVSRVISQSLPPNVQYFLEIQRMVVIGSVDSNNRVQASVLTGNPGFIQALDENTIRIEECFIDTSVAITGHFFNLTNIKIARYLSDIIKFFLVADLTIYDLFPHRVYYQSIPILLAYFFAAIPSPPQKQYLLGK